MGNFLETLKSFGREKLFSILYRIFDSLKALSIKLLNRFISKFAAFVEATITPFLLVIAITSFKSFV